MAEKSVAAVKPDVVDVVSSTSPSAVAESTGHGKLHLVARSDELHDKPESDIRGYDEELMRDRVLLSSEEEKRLLRKVDLYLLPLMSLIYMVKTIDANNVSSRASHGDRRVLCRVAGPDVTLLIIDIKCQNYGQGNRR